MTDTITSQVQTAAANEGLGQLRQRYHGRFRLSAIFVIALAVLFGAAVASQFLTSSTDTAAVLLPFYIPFLAITIWFWRWEHRHSSDDLYLFDGGMIHVDRKGVLTSYPWAGIIEVRTRRMDLSVENVPVRTVHFIKVVRGDGASVALNNRFRGIAQLGTIVQELSANARLPFALDVLRAGNTINFDGLVVDLQGIRHGGRTLAWPTIVYVGAAEGALSTKVIVQTSARRRPYTRRLFPSRPFPNLRLLGNISQALNVDRREATDARD